MIKKRLQMKKIMIEIYVERIAFSERGLRCMNQESVKDR